MANEQFEMAQRRETSALTRGLEQAQQQGHAADAEWVRAALERIGDTIRLGEPAPRELLAAASRLEPGLLACAITMSREEVTIWVLPDRKQAAAELDGFDFTLRRRDEIHSFVLGLTRVALRLGHGSEIFEGYAKLSDVIAQFDRALAEVCSRQTAESLLGTRIVLQPASTWLDVLGDEDAISNEGDGIEIGAAMARPSAAEVEAYASTAAVRAYVEGFALRDDEFCAELCAAIDGLLELGEPVSFTARIFRKRRAAAPRVTADFQFSLDTRLAAASDDLIEQEQRLQLGEIPELDANASLTLRANELELSVYSESELVLVQLGEARTTAPQESANGVSIWRARVNVDPGTQRVRIVVRDAANREIDEEFTVEVG